MVMTMMMIMTGIYWGRGLVPFMPLSTLPYDGVLSRVQLFGTPWTGTHQAPLSLGFPRQGYWSGLPFPSLGDLPNPGIDPPFPTSPALQVDSLLLYHREAQSMVTMTLNLNWKVMTIYSSNFGIKVLESLWLQTDMILALWPGSTNKN